MSLTKKAFISISISILALSIPSFAFAGVKCLTWSNQILFMAQGTDEKQTAQAVVDGCINHDFTNPTQCKDNLRCFPDGDPITLDGDSNWKTIQILN